MKKFFYLMSLCLCMFMGAATLSSCGDDDLDIKNVQTGITENGNTITLSFNYYNIYTQISTATFDDNGLCIKYIDQMNYSSKDACNTAWDLLQSVNAGDTEELAKYSKSGKTITYDDTEYFKGWTKTQVRQYFERELKEAQEEE